MTLKNRTKTDMKIRIAGDVWDLPANGEVVSAFEEAELITTTTKEVRDGRGNNRNNTK